MTHDEFSQLVNRLEQQARDNPLRYQRHTLLLAMLGNVYLLGVVLLLLALLLGMLASIVVLKAVGVKLSLLLGFFLWGVLKALWIKLPPPQGQEIRAAQAPALFAMIAELQQALGAPRFHHVLITDDFNAGVIQAPQLGMFGWHRNYLLIGLPLLKALSPEQFKAVLAHEFGHLAKGHARTGNWIYRQRYRWSRLMDQLQAQQSWGSFLFRPFLQWYAPYLNAYSFPLARANEYEADAAAARLTSPRASAEALTNVNVVGAYLQQHFWPGLHKQADNLPQPGFMPYASMGRQLSGELSAETATTLLQQALQQTSNIDDTHPAFSDRLQAIGETPHLAPPAPGQAADTLLGSALEPITHDFDQRWLDYIQPHWAQRYQETQQGREQLAQLNQRQGDGDALGFDERYQRALLTESIAADAESALAQLQILLQQQPDNLQLCFSVGARQLMKDDAAGVALLKQVWAGEPNLKIASSELLRDYFWRQGEQDTAHAWHQHWLEANQQHQAAEQERNQILLSDKFERHDLQPAVLASLLADLRRIDAIKKVYLVRKQVAQRPDRPCYVLGFTLRSWSPFGRTRRAQQAIATMQAQITFPVEVLLVCVEGDNYRFGRKFRWMRGSRIL